MFENPLAQLPKAKASRYWHRVGEALPSITIAPAIERRCWRGHILNGNVFTM